MVKSTRTNDVWENTDDTLLCGTVWLGLSPVALAVLRGQGAGGMSCASRGRTVQRGVWVSGVVMHPSLSCRGIVSGRREGFWGVCLLVWFGEMGGGDGALGLKLAAALPTHWGPAGGCTAGSRQKRRIARFC